MDTNYLKQLKNYIQPNFSFVKDFLQEFLYILLTHCALH